jgi:putative flippase GtrA
MSLTRQGRHYLLIGGVQWLLDWGVMVLISHLGAKVEVANVCGRISGAMVGFWLNGKITFSSESTTVGRKQLQRFVLMWLCNTAISTFAIGHIDEVFGLQWAWIAKPAIELTLGLIGFLLSRYWVYKT